MAHHRMVWTYAPGVGLVKAVGTVETGGPPIETAKLELTSFDVGSGANVGAASSPSG